MAILDAHAVYSAGPCIWLLIVAPLQIELATLYGDNKKVNHRCHKKH